MACAWVRSECGSMAFRLMASGDLALLTTYSHHRLPVVPTRSCSQLQYRTARQGISLPLIHSKPDIPIRSCPQDQS